MTGTTVYVKRGVKVKSNRCLVSFIPEMPLKARLPVNVVDVETGDYFLPPISDSYNEKGTTSPHGPSLSTRSDSYNRYDDAVALSMNMERPTDEIAIVAPPLNIRGMRAFPLLEADILTDL